MFIIRHELPGARHAPPTGSAPAGKTGTRYSRNAGLPALSSAENRNVAVPAVSKVIVLPEASGIPFMVAEEVAMPVPASAKENVTVAVVPIVAFVGIPKTVMTGGSWSREEEASRSAVGGIGGVSGRPVPIVSSEMGGAGVELVTVKVTVAEAE